MRRSCSFSALEMVDLHRIDRRVEVDQIRRMEVRVRRERAPAATPIWRFVTRHFRSLAWAWGTKMIVWCCPGIGDLGEIYKLKSLSRIEPQGSGLSDNN